MLIWVANANYCAWLVRCPVVTPTLRARLVFRMAEVIAADQAEASSLANQAAEDKRAGYQEPEHDRVEHGVDGEAGPDGAEGKGFEPPTSGCSPGFKTQVETTFQDWADAISEKTVLIRTANQWPSRGDYGLKPGAP